MRNTISKIGQSIKLPGLSFLMAFTITGIIIALSDSKVMGKIGSPIDSPIGKRGLRDEAGSWNTIPVWRRIVKSSF